MPRIIPRSEHGLVREPPSSRSKVVRPTGWLLTHYTGGGGSVTDGKSDAQHMAELAAYARNAGKEWEYNYVITAPLGYIWEMAGVYRGAHCQNFNEQSLAVQMNLGVGASPNQAMIDSHRWLREELTRTGQWRHQAPSPTAGQDGNVPHYRFRSTACCGSIMAAPAGARWASPTGEGSLGNLLPFMTAPYSTTPLPPPGGAEEDMAWLIRCTTGNATQNAVTFAWNGVNITVVTAEEIAVGKVTGSYGNGGQILTNWNPTQLQELINNCWSGPAGGTIPGFTTPTDPAKAAAASAEAARLAAVSADTAAKAARDAAIAVKDDEILAAIEDIPAGGGGGEGGGTAVTDADVLRIAAAAAVAANNELHARTAPT